MADIIPFGRPGVGDPEKDGWLSGEAVCLSCAHRWVQVAPRGSRVNAPDEEEGMTCPKCTSHKGVLTRFALYTDVPSWGCNKCSGFLFSAFLAKGDVPMLACACCGELLNALDLFNHKGRAT